jgi:D-alanine-D-alanine ligase
LPSQSHERLAQLAVKAFQALGIRHYARVDFRVNESSVPMFLEANYKPDLTRSSLFAQSARLAGMTYSQLIDSLLQLALNHESLGRW